MPLTAITVAGTYKKPDGSAAAGTVRFNLLEPIIDGTGNVIVGTHEQTVTLDGTGSFSTTLYATEGTGLLPTGNAYEVEEFLTGAPRRRYSIALPSSPTTVDLADFVPVAARPTYLLVESVVAGTNVTVDSTDPRHPIVSAAGGGGGGVTDHGALTGLADDDHTQYLNNARGDARYDAIGAAAAAQAAAVQRANHTGTQSADTLTDGTTNKAFLATERTKLAGVATGATANDTDANLKARANHTGTQSADTLTDGTTNKAFLATERTKLSGIATGATANDTDANLKNRANHTGTQAATTVTYAGGTGMSATDVEGAIDELATEKADKATFPVCIGVALSDETTAITAGTAKVTMRAPFAFTLTAVRASLNTASTSGIPTVDINESGTTVLSTKLTIDASEKTSQTAATAAVISDSAIADDAELTFDIDVAGTGAKGLKVWLIGTRVLP